MSRRFSPDELARCRCSPEQLAGVAFAAECPLHGARESTRYEDEAPRLAGEATQGRWTIGAMSAQLHLVDVRRDDGLTLFIGCSRVDAALIAYHHPARVVALAAVVRAAREVRRLHRRDSLETDIAAAESALDEALRRLDEEA